MRREGIGKELCAIDSVGTTYAIYSLEKFSFLITNYLY